MTLIAQLSDLHLRDDGKDPFHDPAAALRAAFAQIAALDPAPELILITGDLIDRSASDYGRVRALLAEAPCPVRVMPGNHDHREPFRAAFGADHGFAPGHLSWRCQAGGLGILALDSTLADGSGGVDAERLGWLAGALAAGTGPALLALHHPPFPTGVPRIDAQGFAGAAELAALLRGSRVRRLIAGHSHVAVQSHWAGIPVSTAPALGHALSLGFGAGGAQGPQSGPQSGPPGFELHLIREDLTASFLRPLSLT